jgi:hypothetical protein
MVRVGREVEVVVVGSSDVGRESVYWGEAGRRIPWVDEGCRCWRHGEEMGKEAGAIGLVRFEGGIVRELVEGRRHAIVWRYLGDDGGRRRRRRMSLFDDGKLLGLGFFLCPAKKKGNVNERKRAKNGHPYRF